MSDAALADDHASRRVERHKSGLTPEQEIEQVRQTLERTSKERDDLRGQVSTLSGQVVTAGKSASDAEVARISERESSLTTAINAAEASKASANTAWKAARDAGNIEAEQAAQEALIDAGVQLKALSIEKANFDSVKPRLIEEAKKKGEVQAPVQGNKPSAESQAWLDSHPMFFSDPVYKADALEAHDAAIRAGVPNGTTAYVNFLNTRLERIHGANHGSGKSSSTAGDRQVDQHRGSSSATPPGRDLDSAFSDTIDGSTLRLSRNGEGKDVLSGTIPAAWREAAKWNNMDEVTYSISQMKIREEIKSGQSVGVQMGDGMIFR